MIDVSILLNYGPMGIILAWFMFRMEKVVNNNTEVLIAVKEKIKGKK